jgi:hypothetical protein
MIFVMVSGFTRPGPIEQRDDRFLVGLEPTDAGPDDGAGATGEVLVVEREARGGDGLDRGSHVHLDVPVHATGFLALEPVLGVEVLQLPGELGLRGRGIERGDRSDARSAGEHAGPGRGDVVAER